MTKAELVTKVAQRTGLEKVVVSAAIEAIMVVIKETMAAGENVYLRGFGTFLVKKRRQKTARNITKNTSMIVPEHNIPAFRAAKSFEIN